MALYFFIHRYSLGKQISSAHVDSTQLPVCDNHRIHSQKVHKGIGARGKTFTAWFLGLKLHLAINDVGELLVVSFTECK